MRRTLSVGLAVTCTILLTGSGNFSNPERVLEVDRDVPQELNGEVDEPADATPAESTSAGPFSAMALKAPAARWIVTIAIAGDIQTVKVGAMIDLLSPAVGDTAGLVPDMPGPSDEEVLQNLPKQERTGRVTRDNVRINVERLVNRLDQPRMYPMIGVAQIHSQHFKCTVSSRKTTHPDSPTARKVLEESKEVVYIEHRRLVSPIGRPVVENVQVVGVTHDRGAGERGDRILIAVTGPQVLKLKAASSSSTLHVRPHAAK